METGRYGHVDCRQGPPAGWQIVTGMKGSDSGRSHQRARFWGWIENERIEHYDALVNFLHVDAQYFPKAHFCKPAHYRPQIEVLIPAELVVPDSIEEGGG